MGGVAPKRTTFADSVTALERDPNRGVPDPRGGKATLHHMSKFPAWARPQQPPASMLPGPGPRDGLHEPDAPPLLQYSFVLQQPQRPPAVRLTYAVDMSAVPPELRPLTSTTGRLLATLADDGHRRLTALQFNAADEQPRTPFARGRRAPFSTTSGEQGLSHNSSAKLLIFIVNEILADGTVLNNTCTPLSVTAYLLQQQWNLNRWYSSVSGGTFAVDFDVNSDGTPDIVSVVVPTQPDCGTLASLAQEYAAANTNYDPSHYDGVLMYQPRSDGPCYWAMATVGCAPGVPEGCWNSVSDCYNLDAVFHETGHNIGFHHSGMMASNGVFWEYWDDSCQMGRSFTSPFHRKGYNAVHLWLWGVLGDDRVLTIANTSINMAATIYSPYAEENGIPRTKLWRLGPTGNLFVGYRSLMDPGVDRHVNYAYFPNKLGRYSYTGQMYPYTSQLLIYQWANAINATAAALRCATSCLPVVRVQPLLARHLPPCCSFIELPPRCSCACAVSCLTFGRCL
jgi:hypothetical protein